MHTLEALELYSQFHPRWFEGPDAYAPTSEYVDVVNALLPQDWTIERQGLWYFAHPPEKSGPKGEQPEHGWKLHVSVSTNESTRALGAALRALREEAAPFKFLLDCRITSFANGKLWPRGSSGKFLAVYPRDVEQFRRLGERLAENLAGFSGPYILSDRRWPGSASLYYRYGGFRLRSRLQADGLRRPVIQSPTGEMELDLRMPYWTPPVWATDPFPAEEKATTAKQQAFGDGRFTIESALSFSNRGGVYKGRDRQDGPDGCAQRSPPLC